MGGIVLIVLGVPQTLAGPATVTTLEGARKSLPVDQLPLLKSSSSWGERWLFCY